MKGERIQERIPEWLRAKMQRPARTKEELEAELDRKIKSGEMTPEEAELEWQDFTHRGEDSFQGVYGW